MYSDKCHEFLPQTDLVGAHGVGSVVDEEVVVTVELEPFEA